MSIRNISKITTTFVVMFLAAGTICAQTDKREVRAGNRKFKKMNYQEAEIDYRRALVKDSISFAANYNLANTLYKEENMEEAAKILEKIKDQASVVEESHAADYHYNKGNVSVDAKQWQEAVDNYKQALLVNPGDLDAKENYIYAKKMLENQQNQQNQNQNQDQNQDNNKDQNQQDQNQDQQDQNKDQNKDQNQQNQDQNQDESQNQQGQQPKISPKQAQQMLKAIQAKEKETQDKVKKEKAEAMKSRRKEKNW